MTEGVVGALAANYISVSTEHTRRRKGETMYASIVTILLPFSVMAAPVGLVPAIAADTSCIVMNANLDTRRSPLDSLTFMVQGSPVKVCYGRPSARGRTMIGGSSVPFGKIWRTGANEPTMLHTAIPLDIGGVRVGPGTYSVYTVPGETTWQIVLNSSITQWGHERNYTGDVAAQEIGRASAPSDRVQGHVETFTMRAEPSSDGSATLIMEWEHTTVKVPFKKG